MPEVCILGWMRAKDNGNAITRQPQGQSRESLEICSFPNKRIPKHLKIRWLVEIDASDADAKLKESVDIVDRWIRRAEVCVE